MRDMMARLRPRRSLELPDNQQVVVAVRLLYLPGKTPRGLPGEIVMKGDRRPPPPAAVQMEEQ